MTVAPKLNKPLQLHRTTYDRSACEIGIVHLGYGAFHRAHQAIYIDDYMELTGDLNWGIAAVNLRASESLAFDNSSQIQGGYAIKTTDSDGTLDMRLVRSHIKFVDWSLTPENAEQLLANPTVHMATITVTESGYYLDKDGGLDLNDPVITEEISGANQLSIYAYLANGLQKRSKQIDQPISILCCDNIRSNGHMLRRNFLTYLKVTKNLELAEWVSLNVSFPNSMVDRITPRAASNLNTEIIALFGLSNTDPIQSEAFTQWVLEDNFAGPTPDLSKSGVEIVNDVDPFEEAKIRILNGGHTALSYLGALSGYKTFDQAINDPELRKHFDGFQTQEVLPGLTLNLPFNKSSYLNKITTRFGNQAIADQLERICMDGYSKMQLYIRPTLTSCLEQGINPVYSYDCIASWYVYARRFKQGKMPIAYHEPYWDQLSLLLDKGAETAFANTTQLWGDLPEKFPTFVPELLAAIQRMEKAWPA